MSKRFPLTGLFVLLICAVAVPSTSAQGPTLLESIGQDRPIELAGEPVPLEIFDVRSRYEKEMLLTLWDRPQVLLWLKRSTRYFPYIAEQLRQRGMPEDLKYLAVAESALRPHAGSSKGAVGYWQLMPETARKYSLIVDDFIDERRNLFLSTPAALTYLQELHDRFSSWTLAVAAYNMGEEGLTAEVLEQNTRNFYLLYLPLETQRFIFRVVAAKQVLSNPSRYGFDIADQERYPPPAFDTVDIDCFQEVPIRLIAEAAATHFKVIKDLNPHFRGYYIQAGRHRVNLPKGQWADFQGRLDDILTAFSSSKEMRLYIVRAGDNLSEIAERFGVPLAALMIWNRIGLKHTIHPGDRLVIYARRLEQIPTP